MQFPLLFLLVLLVSTASAACPSTHPSVGFSTTLTTVAHSVAGTLTILDDCTFEVTSFTYSNPTTWAYWHGTATIARPAMGSVTRVVNQLPASAPATQTFTLAPGKTWNDFAVLGIFCEQFPTWFGYAELPSSPSSGCSSASDCTANGDAGASCTAGACVCSPGTRGTLCNIHDGDCSTDAQCTAAGDNNAYCTGFSPSKSCACSAGRSGAQCETVEGTCTVDSDCNAGGDSAAVCSGSAPSKSCLCSSSGTGTYCGSVGVCTSNADCQTMTMNATCSGLPPRQACQCESPYIIGDLCDKRNYTALALDGMFDHCSVLQSEDLNVEWTVDTENSRVYISLLGGITPGDQWMAFGFSPDSSSSSGSVSMVPGDVTIAGFFNNAGFAIDYNLGSTSQCNPSTGVGVCPDASTGAGVDNAHLLTSTIIDGVIRVTFWRPLSTGDGVDVPIDPSTPMSVLWAHGPLSDSTTAPVVLKHVGGDRTSSPTTLTLSPASATSTCAVQVKAPQSALTPGTVEVLRHTTELVVTTGTNENYPNPPKWGISYRLNGVESPVLQVERGRTYTFSVAAGPEHPLYITDSILGGGMVEGELVVAGGSFAHGDETAPFVLEWTPDASTPDLLYYQCWAHQKLGWRVEVYDFGQTPSPQDSGAIQATGAFWTTSVAVIAALFISWLI